MDQTTLQPTDVGMCETVCRESGWLGELLVLALVALRAAYVQRKLRSAEADRASLQEKVRELSLRPPPGAIAGIPVTLQLAPNPGAHELLGATLSARPSDPQKPAQNEVSTAGDSPEPSDPDWLAPPRDEP